MKQEELLLYIGDGCPYCHHVLDFMQEHNLEIATKDIWKDDQAKGELSLLTGGKTQVPCLKMGDNKFMHESLDIIKKLEEWFLT